MAQTIRFLITSNDVLHAFGVPELGIKLDAVPGRLNTVSTMITNLVFILVLVMKFVVFIMDLCLLYYCSSL